MFVSPFGPPKGAKAPGWETPLGGWCLGEAEFERSISPGNRFLECSPESNSTDLPTPPIRFPPGASRPKEEMNLYSFFLARYSWFSAKLCGKLCATLRETEYLLMGTFRNFITGFLISTSLRPVSFGMTVAVDWQRSASQGWLRFTCNSQRPEVGDEYRIKNRECWM